MNRGEFENFMQEEFQIVFNNPFSREMLSNILDYGQSISDESEQYSFLCKMIPEVTKRELRELYL